MARVAQSKGNLDLWTAWGPPVPRPFGLLPKFREWHYPIEHWTFEEWQRQGEAVGSRILPLQAPWYYHRALPNLTRARSRARTAHYFGVALKSVVLMVPRTGLRTLTQPFGEHSQAPHGRKTKELRMKRK